MKYRITSKSRSAFFGLVCVMLLGAGPVGAWELVSHQLGVFRASDTPYGPEVRNSVFVLIAAIELVLLGDEDCWAWTLFLSVVGFLGLFLHGWLMRDPLQGFVIALLGVAFAVPFSMAARRLCEPSQDVRQSLRWVNL